MYSYDVNKLCRNQTDVKNHQHIRGGEHPNTCNFCKKSFSLLTCLKRHERIHSGECHYTCDVCNKSFTEQGHLKAHECIHSGELHIPVMFVINHSLIAHIVENVHMPLTFVINH